MDAYVAGINVYPIKSCGGTSVGRAYLDRSGFQNDRKWMVVDSDGNFLSQRDLPRMALIQPRLASLSGCPSYQAGQLIINAPGMPEVRSSFLVDRHVLRAREARVRDDTCLVFDQGDQASAWFSEFMGTPCKLVRIAENGRMHRRSSTSEETFALNGQDGGPVTIIGQASLDDLNNRLAVPVPMCQFRANIVVAGIDAYAEDGWGHLRIGIAELFARKPCSRCTMITINQKTAECGEEPWRTLATYRLTPEGEIEFGVQFYSTNGFISVGDSVEIFA